MSLAARQRLMAAFLTDPALEARVRADPEAAAREHGVSPSFARWLAALEERRVRSFRRSRQVKARRRGGSGDVR